ncbi:MAG: multicopper oxidase domain-containing protein [Myxococcales bacterium]|nr:multicopper oxidase domain-containing protein [Myxococcales bacterium]
MAVALSACSSDAGDDATAADCFEVSDGVCVQETFANPPVLEPGSDGVYRLRLAATEVELDGQRHCVRAYNGSYVGPTIDTPAREGTTPRSIRVDLWNALSGHDYRSLGGDECTCSTASGTSCIPDHIHDACATERDDDCVCVNADGDVCEHMFDFNVTNLHAHGSHVRPDYARGGEVCEPVVIAGVPYECRECGDDVCDGDSSDDTCFHGDNVLNRVHPGAGARYRWDIDEDGTHHTGLQWYHPHIHGTTAMQVASGAAGAWIVRGPLDSLPGVANAKERVMLFSTPSIARNGFEPLADGEACTDETITFDDFETLSATSAPQLNVLNGVRRPRLVTAPDQVERWRILHAGFLDEVFIGVFRGLDPDCESFDTDEPLAIHQIGRDGLILPQEFEHPWIFMSPGYRVEAIVGGQGQLSHGDTWCFVAARFLQDADTEHVPFAEQPFSPDTAPEPSDIVARFDSDGDVFAIMNVSRDAGPATETQLPDFDAIGALAPPMDLDGVAIADRCAAAVAETDVTAIDQVAVLQVGAATVDDPDPCDCANYNVNCTNFEEVDRTVYPADRDLMLDAVEHWRIAASFDGHPFHIHINPYIVCPNDNVFDPIPFPHWRDTYLVNMSRHIDIITQNRAFTGPFVFHCHKLTHEDHGMMELIRVCDPATDPTCGDFDWRACADGDAQCERALAATDCAVAARNDAEAFACINALARPGGVCALDAPGPPVP